MTFTVVATSADRRWSGVATATCTLAVGASVPAVAPGVGAVASQAWTNRSLRSLGLDALRDGRTPQEAIRVMRTADDGFGYRQVAVVGASGATASHTGEEVTGWAGSIAGDGWVVLGNYLVGPPVLEAMATVMRSEGEDFGALLVRALVAGQAAGGDSRGRQSAALALAQHGEIDAAPPDLWCDLRVDDDRTDPAAELARLYAVHLAEEADLHREVHGRGVGITAASESPNR
ncbi:MAG: DUF1028 domain-containing protein [Propioniciclava sp.]